MGRYLWHRNEGFCRKTSHGCVGWISLLRWLCWKKIQNTDIGMTWSHAVCHHLSLRPNNCKTTILQSIHCRSWFPACAKIKEKESQQRGEYQSVETQYKKNWLSGFGNLAVLRWPSNERSDPLSFGGFVTTVPKWVLDYTLFCLSFLTQQSVGHFLWHLILSICYSLSVHTFTCNNIVISASMSTHFLPLSLNLFDFVFV